jgi:alcohol dehydrogenase class IV
LCIPSAEVPVIPGIGEQELAPLEAVLAQGRTLDPQVVLAIGGGSVLDLGKALTSGMDALVRVMDPIWQVRPNP